MKRIVSLVLWLPAAVALIAFVVANRQWVTLSFDPFNVPHPAFAIPMPLWSVLMAGVFIGILVGWAASWVKQGRARKRARAQKAELERLRRQVANASPPQN
ncbi:MAG: LapA family protein, partial [Aestuariivirgaceae bacterium]|nr:LapA family protein [Aestuariivirgaceae bacterium]